MSPRDGMNKQKIFYSKWKILKKKKKDITEYRKKERDHRAQYNSARGQF